jgi:hypothetical protein
MMVALVATRIVINFPILVVITCICCNACMATQTQNSNMNDILQQSCRIYMNQSMTNVVTIHHDPP